ncbi:MAG: glycosyltransferase family protein, partial [Alphaproteobacteria bacterium]
MTRHRVLFHVQHLLGIGHLRRVALLARACAARGLEVVVASGGPPVGGLDLGAARLVQLPPMRSADESFHTLVDENDRPVGAAFEARRRGRLLDLLARLRPRALVIEMFPFGRRRLRFELLPLLEAARDTRPRPWIACSVRDVLTARTPERRAEAVAWAQRHFDAVLVHGDPAAIPLAASLPEAATIADRIAYTGYVAGPPGRRARPGGPGWNEVVVSAGGGAVGEALLRTALEARKTSGTLARLDWRLLAGGNLAGDAFAELAAAAPAGVAVERARDDFPDLLSNCAVSLSQGGYNTLVEVVQARARAVVVPFARG